MDSPQQISRYWAPCPGDGGVLCGEAQEGGGPCQGEEKEEEPAESVKEKPVADRRSSLFLVSLPQPAGENGAEAHPDARAEGHQQHLDGVGVREGQKGLVAVLGHIDAVHQIVDGADEHGQHDGQGHSHHQTGTGMAPSIPSLDCRTELSPPVLPIWGGIMAGNGCSAGPRRWCPAGRGCPRGSRPRQTPFFRRSGGRFHSPAGQRERPEDSPGRSGGGGLPP